MLRTSATRGFVGAASVALPSLAIVGRVDIFHRVKVRPCGSPSYGSRAHGARPDAQTAGRCDGRSGYLNRRRSRGSATTEDSWWFHPAEQRIVRLRSQRRPAGSPRAAGLHWSSEGRFAPRVRRGSSTTGAGDAATGSRERSSTGPIAPLPEWVQGPGQTRVDRDTMAGVVRSSDRAIDGWHGRSGARPNTSTQLGRFRVSARMRAGWLLASASIAGRDTAVPGKHRDAPTCTG